jgi:hypothetical protein
MIEVNAIALGYFCAIICFLIGGALSGGVLGVLDEIRIFIKHINSKNIDEEDDIDML